MKNTYNTLFGGEKVNPEELQPLLDEEMGIELINKVYTQDELEALRCRRPQFFRFTKRR